MKRIGKGDVRCPDRHLEVDEVTEITVRVLPLRVGIKVRASQKALVVQDLV